MESLQRLVGHLPEIKDVHVEEMVYDTRNINCTMAELIACPVLTNFTIKSAGFTHVERSTYGHVVSDTVKYVPWYCANETVSLAIW